MRKSIIFILVLVALTFMSIGTARAANPLDPACNTEAIKNLDDNHKPAACLEDGTKNPVSGGKNGVLYKATLVISTLAGVIAVIIAIVGGINMMTSDGDSQKFKNARNTLIFAAIGLVIIALAQGLVTLVINRIV